MSDAAKASAVTFDRIDADAVTDVQVRPRTSADLKVLLPLLQQIHEREGYPVRAEAVSADWLTSADKPGVVSQPELAGWVAVSVSVSVAGEIDGGRVVGPLALHPPAGPCLPLWVAGTGRAPNGIAVVSRLFTDRTVRGAGSVLLEHAVAEAVARGRRAVLEVDASSPAHALYVRRGWHEQGRVVQQWGHRAVDSAALISPEAS